MRLLLDTHIFLWYITNDSRLSPEVAETIRDEKLWSSISLAV